MGNLFLRFVLSKLSSYPDFLEILSHIIHKISFIPQFSFISYLHHVFQVMETMAIRTSLR